MALKFYFDTHIAKAAATQLRKKGVDVVRCEEVGLAQASDEEHLQYAADNGRVMVSQDEDFLALDAQWQQADRSHAGIMKVSRQYQGDAQVSHIVQGIAFYVEAEHANAVNYVEIANHVIYL